MSREVCVILTELRGIEMYLIFLINMSSVLTSFINNYKCCFLSITLDKTWHLFQGERF